jgi:hypothetical protein
MAHHRHHEVTQRVVVGPLTLAATDPEPDRGLSGAVPV